MRLPPILALSLSLVSASLAAQQLPIPSGTVREGTLSFDGKATMGDFTGTTTTVSGSLTGGATLAEIRGAVEAPVQTLVSGNGKRDKDLNKSMESERFPTMRFELDGVEAGSGTPDSLPVTLRGRMILHGVTREVSIPSVLRFRADGVRVQGRLPQNLKDYQIGGLTKMLGMLKMHEDIVVHIDVDFAFTP
ncbi:MAG: YceI family protein [Gemmatimonadales bacterium]